MIDARALRERLEQWQRFNRWEEETAGSVPVSPAELARWYAEAWELSRRCSPGWVLPEVDMEKIGRLRRLEEAFARMRGGGVFGA